MAYRQISIKTLYVCAASLVLTGFYLAQWFSLPLYPDEIGERLLSARIFYDGPTYYGLYGLCPSNARAIPLVFFPAAYSFAFIDWASGWELVRWLPFLSLFALLAAISLVIGRVRYNGFEALFLCSGFIGIAGAGLILSRPEYMYNLQVALLIFTYWRSSRKPLEKYSIIALALANIYVSTLSLFYHPQIGLLFLPLTALMVLRLSLRHTSWRPAYMVPVLTAGFLYLGLVAHAFWTFHCKEDPVMDTGFPAYFTTIGKITDLDSFKNILSQHTEKYKTVFHFAASSPGNILPEIADKDFIRKAHILNPFMNFLTQTGIIGVCLIAAGLLARLLSEGVRIIKAGFSWSAVQRALVSDWLLMLYASCAWVALYVCDAQAPFYRTFSLNLFAVVLIVLAATHLTWRPVKAVISAVGIIAALLCLFSSYLMHAYLTPGMDVGYAGPSIPLTYDWPRIKEDVDAVEKQCGIAENESGILIDDLTYDAVKTHTHLIPITYVWWSNSFLKNDFDALTPRQRLANLKTIAHSMVTKCSDFSAYGIEYQAKVGGVCCVHF